MQEAIFTAALGVESPWFVEFVAFDAEVSERPSRSSFPTISTSSLLSALRHLVSSGRFVFEPEALSVNMRLHPACFNAVSCKSGF